MLVAVHRLCTALSSAVKPGVHTAGKLSLGHSHTSEYNPSKKKKTCHAQTHRVDTHRVLQKK